MNLGRYLSPAVRLCSVVLLFAFSIDSASAHGRILRVASNGLDSSNCGSNTQPCRSISQGIVNADPGDTILVGPGRYGDLNDDSDYDDPGDEDLSTNGQCIVCVNKQLRLISTHGAEATVIQPALGNPIFLSSVVDLSVSGITFGEAGKGFTIKRGQATGLHSTENNVRVTGNISLDNFDFGFECAGNGVLSNNIATGSNIGITVHGNWQVTDNVAIGNTVLGIGASGELVRFRRNISTNNGRGFTVATDRATVEHNLASGNDGESDSGVGFALFGSDVTFVYNTAVGNRGYGVYFWPKDPAGQPTIKRNNIYANDSDTNCGFVNRSALTVDATQNYWGAFTGPGPDPADNAGVGSGCDLGIGVATVIPFASQPF